MTSNNLHDSEPSNKKRRGSSSKELIACMLILLASRSTFTISAFKLSHSLLLPISKRREASLLRTKYHLPSNIFFFATMSHSEHNTFLGENDIVENEVKRAKLISTSSKDMSEAGARIRSGHLVSFPTETVYGLGCHAIDPVAVSRVFEAKERPLSDPLIVHVNEAQNGLKLWDACICDGEHNLEKDALEALTERFWPGPLTLVAKAAPEIPSIIMANTGFVACRSPSHPIARALIAASGVPIAAPSANKFGHVSPTRASHVMNDLGSEDVWIVDPDLDKQNQDALVCDIGVESTVVKVLMSTETSGIVSILRHGAISSTNLKNCLEAAGLSAHFQVNEKMQATGDTVNHVAPGQTIRHYSPNVQSFMISHDRYTKGLANGLDNSDEIKCLEGAVIIDFGGRLHTLKENALAYRDLSTGGNSNIAAANVFDTLRWAENIENAQRVYFPELVVDESDYKEGDTLIMAVKDRLTRAASGVVIDVLQ